ncbi:MAG TPA: antitoxin Xre/MbcA/ParS toxin-binding domain-containing protein [Chitinophagaceae bacterium]
MTDVVYLYDKCQTMEKDKKTKKKPVEYKVFAKASKVHEPMVSFSSVKIMPLVKDFNYKEFKKIADKVPFTLQEWSDILHISERTLHRYAKANSSFPFSVTDRILQIDKVIQRGVEVFGSLDKFIRWLRSDPIMLEGRLSLQSLRTIDGINLVLIQLGRIEHGILA